MEYTEYKVFVKKFMQSMKQNSSVIVSLLCKKDTPEKFTKAVKEIMVTEWDDFGWKFEFNEDFTKLKRNSADNLITFEEWIAKK